MKNSEVQNVSIVMPTYNRAGYIRETIESIQAQTYTHWELIIVDDGSDDNTEEIVSHLKDPRVRFYKAGRIAVNGKIKNIGIKKAENDLVAFIDSDDLWAPTKLEKQVNALEQNPGAGFSLTGGYNFRTPHQPIDFFYKQREGALYGDIFIPFFKSEISTTTPSLIFRRQCLAITGGFDESKPFSDIDFILSLASHFKAIILYEPLLYRRLHDTNDSGTNWIMGYREGLLLIRAHKKKLPAGIRHVALFRLYVNFGEDALRHGMRRTAVGKFLSAWKHNPYSLAPIKKIAKTFLYALIGTAESEKGYSSAKPWKKPTLPRRILAIRLQATGDVVITLPYLQYLRRALPATSEIDFLTRKECCDIPKSLSLFNRVISVGGGRSFRKQLLHAGILLPSLFLRRYDAVIDLQANEVSQFVMRRIRPAAFAVFDRFSPKAAGERTRLTIESLGIGPNEMDTRFECKSDIDALHLLHINGWDGKSGIVVLNPAGAFETRNWPLVNYVLFAKLWLQEYPGTQFLVLGTSLIGKRANYLKEILGEKLIDLVGKTSPSLAFATLQHARFVLSEDSGLMHMAWISGIPTLVLFGSTRSDWSKPIGSHTAYVDSSDLPCGNCMQETCRYGDVHCLTRYSPEMIFSRAMTLVNSIRQNSMRRTIPI